MNDTNSSDVVSNGTSSGPPCYPWLWEELIAANLTIQDITLDILNQQFVRRNIGGIIMLCILIVVGLIGNVHVLIIYKTRFGRSNYRIYVIWLAMLDVFNCVVVSPLTIVYLFHPLTFPDVILCKIFRTLLYVAAIASTTSLVIIAIDMRKKIGSPLGEHFSFKQAKLLCFVCIIVAVLLSWPAPVLYTNKTVQTGIPGITGKRCFTDDQYENKPYQSIFQLVLGIYYIVISLLLIIMYISIGRNIGVSRRKFGRSIRGTRVLSSSNDVAHSSSKTLARKTMWTLCTVTMVYILSALPYHILATMIFVNNKFDCNLSLLGSQFFYTFVWSYFINSAVNPFIYGLRDRKFLYHIKSLYSCSKQKDSQFSSTDSVTRTSRLSSLSSIT